MREYLLCLLAAAAVTYLTTPLVERWAVKFGVMAEVRDRDVHAEPTPRLGGLAMFFGLLLAAGTITLIGQVDPSSIAGPTLLPTLLPILLPVAVMAVPVVDLFLAVIRRTRAGRNPFAPDKQHLHHRLLEMGHSQARAVLVMYAWTGLISFTAVAVAFVPVGYALLGFLLGLVGILVAIRPPENKPLAVVKNLRTGTRN